VIFTLSEACIKYRPQEVASNKLEKGPLRDYEIGFCSPVALTVVEIFKDFAFFPKFFTSCSENIRNFGTS
jgi:hypothetical protein